MPKTSVIRLASAAPRVGEEYEFTDGGRPFTGTVVHVSPMRKAKRHVAVTLELTEAEHRRLTTGGSN